VPHVHRRLQLLLIGVCSCILGALGGQFYVDAHRSGQARREPQSDFAGTQPPHPDTHPQRPDRNTRSHDSREFTANQRPEVPPVRWCFPEDIQKKPGDGRGGIQESAKYLVLRPIPRAGAAPSTHVCDLKWQAPNVAAHGTPPRVSRKYFDFLRNQLEVQRELGSAPWVDTEFVVYGMANLPISIVGNDAYLPASPEATYGFLVRRYPTLESASGADQFLEDLKRYEVERRMLIARIVAQSTHLNRQGHVLTDVIAYAVKGNSVFLAHASDCDRLTAVRDLYRTLTSEVKRRIADVLR